MAFGIGNPILGGSTAQGPILGGGQQMPRVPWGQNRAVTMAALGMLGAPTLNQGVQRAASLVPAGLDANTAWQKSTQDRMDRDKRAAAMSAWMRSQSGLNLSPEEQSVLAGSPEVGEALFGASLKKRFEPPELPNTVQEFQYGQKDPAYNEWRKNISQAGAQKSVGPPQPGWRIVYDEAGNPVSQEPIPGSPAAMEAAREVSADRSKVEQKGQKAVTMLDATSSIKDEIKNASTPVTGTLSRPFAMYSGSSAGRVRAYVGALKSGVGLQALSALKELSATGASGFGALNQAELQLLLDQVGALDPDNTEPDIFLKTIDRIEQQWQQVLNDVERTVPPERLVELGIDINDLRGGPGGGQYGGPAGAPPPGTVMDGYRYNGGDPADPNSWTKAQ